MVAIYGRCSKLVTATLLAAFVLPGCGDDESSGDIGDEVESGSNEPPAWRWLAVEGARCRDGSATGIGLSVNDDSDRVLIHLEGGGGCFNEPSCSFNAASYGEADFVAPADGTFSREQPTNPLRDWTHVFVPYCTGDLHGGNSTDAMTVPALGPQQFVGALNMALYLDELERILDDPEQILLSGESAGGFGAIFNANRVRATFPNSSVDLLSDSGLPFDGEYLAPCYQGLWRTTWGYDETVLVDCGSSCPDNSNFVLDYYRQVRDERIDANYGLIGSLEDELLRQFYSPGEAECAGDLYSVERYQQGVADLIAETGPGVGFFLSAGSDHVFLSNFRLYETSSAEVALTDWLNAFVDGEVSTVAPDSSF